MSQAHHEHQSAGVKPNLDPCIMARKPLIGTVAENVLAHGTGAINIDACRIPSGPDHADSHHDSGRWPANLIHDGSDEVLAGFPQAKGAVSNGRKGKAGIFEDGIGAAEQRPGYADDGSAARFFYCAKASKSDRGADNLHPTVKPTDLMAYLCRLVTPPGGVVLDPFMGSGSTGKAAVREGFRFIGIEREAEYVAISRARIEAVSPEMPSIDDLI